MRQHAVVAKLATLSDATISLSTISKQVRVNGKALPTVAPQRSPATLQSENAMICTVAYSIQPYNVHDNLSWKTTVNCYDSAKKLDLDHKLHICSTKAVDGEQQLRYVCSI